MSVRGQYVFFCKKVPLRGKKIVAATERFRQNKHVKREKLSLQYIPLNVLRATFARVCLGPQWNHQYTLLTDVLVAFSNGSIKVRFRVVVKVDQRKDKEPLAIANKVVKTLKNSVETGQLGSFKVNRTVELRGLCCCIDDVSFVRCFTESFVFVIFRWLIDWLIDSFVLSSVRSFRSFAR